MNETIKNTEVPAPVGTSSSAFEAAVTATIDDGIAAKVGKYRWVICALWFRASKRRKSITSNRYGRGK